MEKHTGTALNNAILAKIDEKLEPLFRDGELASRATDHPEILDVKDRNGEDKKILRDQESLYNALMSFTNELTFEELLDNEIYEIPGLKINGSNLNVYIPASKIERIAKIIDANFGSDKEFEELTGIQLPNQIHQYREDRKGKIDGFELLAPSPKRKDETREQYETRLQEHYGDTYTASTLPLPVGDEERTIRTPYPHEQVDYRNNTTPNPDYVSEYYSDLLHERSAVREPSPRPTPGERLVVNESELAEEKIPFLKRAQAKASLVGKALTSGRFWKTVALGGAAFVGIKLAIPVILSPYGPYIVTIGGAALIYKCSKAYFMRRKRLKTRTMPNPEGPEPESTGGTEEPTGPIEPETPEEEADLGEIEIGIRGLQSELLADQAAFDNMEQQIQNLRLEIADPTLPPEEKAAKEAEIIELNKNKKEILEQMQAKIAGIYEQFDRGRSR